MNQDLKNYKRQSGHTLKFVIMSVIGVFLFMALIPDSDGIPNIPLGYAISWLGLTLNNNIQVNGFGILILLAAVLITISLVGSLLTYTVKPAFIMDNERLKKLFHCGIVYLVSKAIAVALVWMVFFRVGPGWLVGWEGARLMMYLIGDASSGSTLMSIFIILGLAIPLLTDFGLMEFLGILIKKVVKFLFTLPGRSSIDLLGSWFSSSAASVIITRDQHEKGYYTGREAAAICVNFTLVSLPFTFVVASTAGLTAHFLTFYLIITFTTLLLAVVMPRIWPLRGIKDDYLPEVGKQIDEEVPQSTSMFSWAVNLASKRASETTPMDVVKSGLSNWLSIFMDLIPVILAWGTIALVIDATTPIFTWISWPFGQFMNLLGVQEAMTYASATVVGFVDMFIPAMMLGVQEAYLVEYAGQILPVIEGYVTIGGAAVYASADYLPEAAEIVTRYAAPLQTRFIIGALSIVQIIYLAETGILILKSRIPLHIGHLAILFVMRTVFALPIIVGLTWLFL